MIGSGGNALKASIDTAPAKPVVTVFPHPFLTQREIHHDLDGPLRAIVDAAFPTAKPGTGVYAEIDGVAVPCELWDDTRPVAGQTVMLRCVPTGGGGKNILRIFAFIALLVVAWYFAPALVGTALGKALALTKFKAFSLIFGIGSILLNALIPPPKPNLPNLSATDSTADPLVHSITGIANRPAPFGAIPRIYGRRKVFPVFPGKSPTQYTEIAGNDQYLRALFLVGMGRLKISDIKLGETPLSDFEDVESEVREGTAFDVPLTLYTKDVDEQAFSIELTKAAEWQVRTTAIEAEEISVDIGFPRGLVEFNDRGDEVSRSVTILIQYREVGAANWIEVNKIVTTDATSSLVRATRKWSVAKGQYEVRLKRDTGDTDDSRIFDDSFWTVLRTFRLDNPVQTKVPVALIALRIRATDQLNGYIDNLSCIAESYVDVYDGSRWVSEQLTRNPAWAYANILTGNSNKRALGQSRLNAAELKAWADRCEADGREFNYIFDSATSVREAARLTCSAGRGTPDIKDGLWTVVEDLEQTVPVQHFTDVNMWGYSGSKAFFERPHALKIQFVNELKDYQQDERIVYDDGYDGTNATTFETLSYYGLTHPDQIWKRARYDIAVGRLRPEEHAFNVDFEHLKCTRGDLVRFSHNVILVGLGASRIGHVSRSDDDAVTAIILNAPIDMEDGKHYGVRIRNGETGDSALHAVETVAGSTQALTLATPIPSDQEQPAVGELAMFGELGKESIEGLVKEIRPVSAGGGLNARLVLVDYNPAILQADQGDIPQWESNITIPPPRLRDLPLTPVIGQIRSDESVLQRSPDGSLVSTMAVPLSLTGGTQQRDDWFYEVRYRKAGVRGSRYIFTPLVRVTEPEVLVLHVDDKATYEVQARVSNGAGVVSEWTAAQSHTVQGKSNPPPDVDTFTVLSQADGTREFAWTMAHVPLDVKFGGGYRIRYKLGSGHAWEDLNGEVTDFALGLLTQSPYETNRLAAGAYTFGIKAVDSSGNESRNAMLISGTLGDPRLEGALVQHNVRSQGFPGTKTDCHVDNQGYLQANGTKTWEDFTADGVTWGTWTKWNLVPANPISYEHSAMDLGEAVTFRPLVTVEGTGTPTITESHSDDDSTYTAFAPLAGQVTARYIKFKVSMAAPEPVITNIRIILEGNAEVEEINDLDMATLSGGSVGDRRLPLVKEFTVITSVSVILQNVTAGYSYTVIDKNPTLGPRIQVFDGAQAPADATIDAIVRGFLAA